MSIIKLVDVCKTYGKDSYKTEALKNINLTINEGDMVSIMGPSGCGKSTLLNIIGCIDTLTSGSYQLNGNFISQDNINSLSRIRNSEIAFIFQNFALVKDYTVWDNVELPLRFRKINKKLKKELIEKNLDYLGILELKDKPIDKLSGGQQQRVAIARALVQESNIILADEPTGSLDQENGKNIINILKELNKNFGKTIIIVTHDLSISNYCDKVINLQDGRILSIT